MFSNICLGGSCTGLVFPFEKGWFEANGDCYYRYPFIFGNEVYYNYVCDKAPIEYARRLLLELIYRGILK